MLESPKADHHPDEGTLQGWIDSELPAETLTSVAEHVRGCPSCGIRVAALQRLAARSRALVEGLGEGVVPADAAAMEAARWSVRRRQAAAGRRRTVRRSAAVAAGLVLVATGAAAALPGSPLRALFPGGSSAATTSAPIATTEGQPAPAGVEAGMAGVSVGFHEGRVEVVLEDAVPGLFVEMAAGGGDQVEVRAGGGTPLRVGTGTVTVRLGDRAQGPVVVRIPPGAGQVTLRSGDRTLATWSQGTARLGEGVVGEARPDGVRIEVPEP